MLLYSQLLTSEFCSNLWYVQYLCNVHNEHVFYENKTIENLCWMQLATVSIINKNSHKGLIELVKLLLIWVGYLILSDMSPSSLCCDFISSPLNLELPPLDEMDWGIQWWWCNFHHMHDDLEWNRKLIPLCTLTFSTLCITWL